VSARRIIEHIAGVDGIQMALDREAACKMFDLPADREGDVAVIARQDVCIGSSRAAHDLTGLKGHRLRTHGGVTETAVPFIVNRPLNDAYKLKAAAQTLKSYQIFDFAINGAQ
jgi:phosphonoacetate hydrolase